MAFTFVQSVGTDDVGGTPGSTDSLTISAATAGSLLVAWVKHEGASTTISVTDGTSTFTPATKSSHGNGDLFGQFHYLLSANGGATTITTNLVASRPYLSLIVFEHTYTGGACTFDVENGNAATGSSLSSGNITTTGTDELVFCGYGEYSTQFPSTEQINGLAASNIRDVPNVNNYSSAWSRAFGATFTGQGTATLVGSADYILRLASFKITAAAGLRRKGSLGLLGVGR